MNIDRRTIYDLANFLGVSISTVVNSNIKKSLPKREALILLFTESCKW
tara:strand:- start:1061 stop:1204 length:144 start_codon:yes stop_codon:yes gene_type:complete